MFNNYHGTPFDWQLEMTKVVRTAKWFNFADVFSVNKQAGYICAWLLYFFKKGEDS
jgi:hypothetical protein